MHFLYDIIKTKQSITGTVLQFKELYRKLVIKRELNVTSKITP